MFFVSIPQGPINTEKTDEEHYTNSEVSIPQGPINTRKPTLYEKDIAQVSIPQGPINTKSTKCQYSFFIGFNSARSN